MFIDTYIFSNSQYISDNIFAKV